MLTGKPGMPAASPHRPKSAHKGGVPSSPGVSKVKASSQQRRRLKQLHWDKIRTPQQGTVWARDHQQNVKLNLEELESLFQARSGHHIFK